MTAVAGRRMAETVARRGGLDRAAAGHPGRRSCARWSAGSSSATSSSTPRSPCRRTTPSATRWRCCPSARTAPSSSSTTSRPGRHRHRGRLRRRRPLRPAAPGDDARPAHAHRPGRPGGGLRRARRRTAASSPRSSTPTGGWSASSPAPARCARRSTARRSTRSGRLRVAAAMGVNGDVEGARRRAARRRRRPARDRHRARPPAADDRGAAGGPRARPGGARSSPATSCRPTAPASSIDAGADIVKVGVGPGRDVHHPDDDRRRAGRSSRPCSSAPRRRPSSAAHVWADGGVRHPRDVALALAAGASAVMIGSWFAGTYESPGDLHIAPDGRAVQGQLRHGLGARGRQPHQRRERRSTGPARRCSRRASPPGGMYLDPARPGVEDLIDTHHRRRALGLHLRRRRAPGRAARAGRRSACRARPGTPRAARCTAAGEPRRAGEPIAGGTIGTWATITRTTTRTAAGRRPALAAGCARRWSSSFMAGEVVAGLLAHSLALLTDAGAHAHRRRGARAGRRRLPDRRSARPAARTPTASPGSTRCPGRPTASRCCCSRSGSPSRRCAGWSHPARVPAAWSPSSRWSGCAVNVARDAGSPARADRRGLNVRGVLAHLVTDVWAFARHLRRRRRGRSATGWPRADAVASLRRRRADGLDGRPPGARRRPGVPRGRAGAASTRPSSAPSWPRIDGVAEVHDLHVWQHRAGDAALSAHVLVRPAARLPRGRPARLRSAAGASATASGT